MTLYEAVAEVQPLGVGINLLRHALAVLDHLGLADQLEAARQVGFKDEVLPGIMKDNAARLLGLSRPVSATAR